MDRCKKSIVLSKVADAVWEWLCFQRCVKYVPWVLDPNGSEYDPIKVGKQEEKDRLLNDLERTIKEVVEDER